MHQSVPGFGEKDEDEEESEDADGAVDEEGGGGGGELVDVLEGLGHHEPPQVGRRVRHRVRPTLRSAGQMFCRQCRDVESYFFDKFVDDLVGGGL